MRERIVRRYSECFKRQVILELESGRFGSVSEARAHYGITGATTVADWLRRFGRNDLQTKVVRVEKPDEVDRIRQLKLEVSQLQKALGQTQAENVLNSAYLKLACERLGEGMDAFKKKCDGRRCGEPSPKGR